MNYISEQQICNELSSVWSKIYDIKETIGRSHELYVCLDMLSYNINHAEHLFQGITKKKRYFGKSAENDNPKIQSAIDLKEMFAEEERLLDERHQKTLERHQEIMAAIEQAKSKKPTAIGVTMSL